MAASRGEQVRQAGIVGGFPVGVVNWDVNAFTLGARAINPAARVTVVYTNSWWDPVKEGGHRGAARPGHRRDRQQPVVVGTVHRRREARRAVDRLPARHAQASRPRAA
ncbi:MAG: BMP family ABC transporter substrate-binding protein [Gemmataceae bacterium]